MSLFNVLTIASSAMTAQGQRLNATASNLANAESVAGPGGQAYRPLHVVFETRPLPGGAGSGVAVREVVEDTREPRRDHRPEHPLADAQGFVSLPNVNPVEQMVDMIAASRAYQTNVDVANAGKSMLLKTLTLGQS